jgi:hypothetical protein
MALKWREVGLAQKAEEDRLVELHRQEREVLRLEQAAVYREELAKFESLERAGAARGNASVQVANGGKGGGAGPHPKRARQR